MSVNITSLFDLEELSLVVNGSEVSLSEKGSYNDLEALSFSEDKKVQAAGIIAFNLSKGEVLEDSDLQRLETAFKESEGALREQLIDIFYHQSKNGGQLGDETISHMSKMLESKELDQEVTAYKASVILNLTPTKDLGVQVEEEAETIEGFVERMHDLCLSLKHSKLAGVKKACISIIKNLENELDISSEDLAVLKGGLDSDKNERVHRCRVWDIFIALAESEDLKDLELSYTELLTKAREAISSEKWETYELANKEIGKIVNVLYSQELSYGFKLSDELVGELGALIVDQNVSSETKEGCAVLIANSDNQDVISRSVSELEEELYRDDDKAHLVKLLNVLVKEGQSISEQTIDTLCNVIREKEYVFSIKSQAMNTMLSFVHGDETRTQMVLDKLAELVDVDTDFSKVLTGNAKLAKRVLALMGISAESLDYNPPINLLPAFESLLFDYEYLESGIYAIEAILKVGGELSKEVQDKLWNVLDKQRVSFKGKSAAIYALSYNKQHKKETFTSYELKNLTKAFSHAQLRDSIVFAMEVQLASGGTVPSELIKGDKGTIDTGPNITIEECVKDYPPKIGLLIKLGKSNRGKVPAVMKALEELLLTEVQVIKEAEASSTYFSKIKEYALKAVGMNKDMTPLRYEMVESLSALISYVESVSDELVSVVLQAEETFNDRKITLSALRFYPLALGRGAQLSEDVFSRLRTLLVSEDQAIQSAVLTVYKSIVKESSLDDQDIEVLLRLVETSPEKMGKRCLDIISKVEADDAINMSKNIFAFKHGNVEEKIDALDSLIDLLNEDNLDKLVEIFKEGIKSNVQGVLFISLYGLSRVYEIKPVAFESAELESIARGLWYDHIKPHAFSVLQQAKAEEKFLKFEKEDPRKKLDYKEAEVFNEDGSRMLDTAWVLEQLEGSFPEAIIDSVTLEKISKLLLKDHTRAQFFLEKIEGLDSIDDLEKLLLLVERVPKSSTAFLSGVVSLEVYISLEGLHHMLSFEIARKEVQTSFSKEIGSIYENPLFDEVQVILSELLEERNLDSVLEIISNTKKLGYELFVKAIRTINRYQITQDMFNRDGVSLIELLESCDAKSLIGELKHLPTDDGFTLYPIEKNSRTLYKELELRNQDNPHVLSLLRSGYIQGVLEQVEQIENEFSNIIPCGRISEWGIEDTKNWAQEFRRISSERVSPREKTLSKDEEAKELVVEDEGINVKQEFSEEEIKANKKLTVQENIAEIIAVLKRAIFLTHGFVPRTIQLISVLMIYRSPEDKNGIMMLIETAEGKTIILVMYNMIEYLQGERVTPTTSSSILANIDAKEERPSYNTLGMTVSDNTEFSVTTTDEKMKAYLNDIMYGTIGGISGDVLFGVPGVNKIFEGKVASDESDDAKIDMFSYITMITHYIPGFEYVELFQLTMWENLILINSNVDHLEDTQEIVFKIGECKDGTGQDCEEYIVTRENYEKGAKDLLCSIMRDLMDKHPQERPIPEHIKEFVSDNLEDWAESAIRATKMVRDVDYVLVEKKGVMCAVPVSSSTTGVTELNMQWSKVLQQFIQMMEGLKLTPTTMVADFISVMELLKKFKGGIVGVTGTPGGPDEQRLIEAIYNLSFIMIPSFAEKRLWVLKSMMVESNDSHIETIAKVAIEESETISVLVLAEDILMVDNIIDMLIKMGFPEEDIIRVARSDMFEHEALSDLIKLGKIVVATNIATRGVNPMPENKEMLVILTSTKANARVGEQGEKRIARVGDIGYATFIVNKEQEKKSLKKKYPWYEGEGETIEELLEWRNLAEGERLKEEECKIQPMDFKGELYKELLSFIESFKEAHPELSKEKLEPYIKQMKDDWSMLFYTLSKEIDAPTNDLREDGVLKEKLSDEKIEEVNKKNEELMERGLLKLEKLTQQFVEKYNAKKLITNPVYAVQLGDEDYLREIISDQSMFAFPAYYKLAEKAVRAKDKPAAKKHLKACIDKLDSMLVFYEKMALAADGVSPKPSEESAQEDTTEGENSPKKISALSKQQRTRINIIKKAREQVEQMRVRVANGEHNKYVGIGVGGVKMLSELFDEDEQDEVVEFQKGGMLYLFDVDVYTIPQKKKSWWKRALGTVMMLCVGIVKVAVGVLGTIASAGTSLSLIVGGIKDIYSSVRAFITKQYLTIGQYFKQVVIEAAIQVLTIGAQHIIANAKQAFGIGVEEASKDAIKKAAAEKAFAERFKDMSIMEKVVTAVPEALPSLVFQSAEWALQKPLDKLMNSGEVKGRMKDAARKHISPMISGHREDIRRLYLSDIQSSFVMGITSDDNEQRLYGELKENLEPYHGKLDNVAKTIAIGVASNINPGLGYGMKVADIALVASDISDIAEDYSGDLDPEITRIARDAHIRTREEMLYKSLYIQDGLAKTKAKVIVDKLKELQFIDENGSFDCGSKVQDEKGNSRYDGCDPILEFEFNGLNKTRELTKERCSKVCAIENIDISSSMDQYVRVATDYATDLIVFRMTNELARPILNMALEITTNAAFKWYFASQNEEQMKALNKEIDEYDETKKYCGKDKGSRKEAVLFVMMNLKKNHKDLSTRDAFNLALGEVLRKEGGHSDVDLSAFPEFKNDQKFIDDYYKSSETFMRIIGSNTQADIAHRLHLTKLVTKELLEGIDKAEGLSKEQKNDLKKAVKKDVEDYIDGDEAKREQIRTKYKDKVKHDGQVENLEEKPQSKKADAKDLDKDVGGGSDFFDKLFGIKKAHAEEGDGDYEVAKWTLEDMDKVDKERGEKKVEKEGEDSKDEPGMWKKIVDFYDDESEASKEAYELRKKRMKENPTKLDKFDMWLQDKIENSATIKHMNELGREMANKESETGTVPAADNSDKLKKTGGLFSESGDGRDVHLEKVVAGLVPPKTKEGEGFFDKMKQWFKDTYGDEGDEGKDDQGNPSEKQNTKDYMPMTTEELEWRELMKREKEVKAFLKEFGLWLISQDELSKSMRKEREEAGNRIAEERRQRWEKAREQKTKSFEDYFESFYNWAKDCLQRADKEASQQDSSSYKGDEGVAESAKEKVDSPEAKKEEPEPMYKLRPPHEIIMERFNELIGGRDKKDNEQDSSSSNGDEESSNKKDNEQDSSSYNGDEGSSKKFEPYSKRTFSKVDSEVEYQNQIEEVQVRFATLNNEILDQDTGGDLSGAGSVPRRVAMLFAIDGLKQDNPDLTTAEAYNIALPEIRKGEQAMEPELTKVGLPAAIIGGYSVYKNYKNIRIAMAILAVTPFAIKAKQDIQQWFDFHAKHKYYKPSAGVNNKVDTTVTPQQTAETKILETLNKLATYPAGAPDIADVDKMVSALEVVEDAAAGTISVHESFSVNGVDITPTSASVYGQNIELSDSLKKNLMEWELKEVLSEWYASQQSQVITRTRSDGEAGAAVPKSESEKALEGVIYRMSVPKAVERKFLRQLKYGDDRVRDDGASSSFEKFEENVFGGSAKVIQSFLISNIALSEEIISCDKEKILLGQGAESRRIAVLLGVNSLKQANSNITTRDALDIVLPEIIKAEQQIGQPSIDVSIMSAEQVILYALELVAATPLIAEVEQNLEKWDVLYGSYFGEPNNNKGIPYVVGDLNNDNVLYRKADISKQWAHIFANYDSKVASANLPDEDPDENSRKKVYEPHDKHVIAGRVGRDIHRGKDSSRGPKMGQEMLDRSIPIPGKGRARIAIDIENKELIRFLFSETRAGVDVYHGHVIPDFGGLPDKIQGAFRKSGIVNRKGIIK